MDDIVERLTSPDEANDEHICQLLDDAADEIERLRGILEGFLYYRKCRDCDATGWHKDITIPLVCCHACGSADTRPIKLPWLEQTDG